MSRTIRLLLVAVILAVAGCSNDSVNVASEGLAGDAESGAPEDSGEVGPTTTAPWEVTLEEYPLLQVLDDAPSSTLISRATFVLADEAGEPVFSGDEVSPQFMIRIESWFGVTNDIEFTTTAADGLIVDGEVHRFDDCGEWWSWLEQTADGSFRYRPGQLPRVRGTDLAWESDGCPPSRPANVSLLEGELSIDVGTDGFVLSNGNGQAATFAKLDPPPPRSEVTTTTIVETTTTTTTG